MVSSWMFAQTDTATTPVDSANVRSLPLLSPDAIEDKISYKATDSIRFDLKNQKIFLYGEGEIYYQDMELKAENIEINMDSNQVKANGGKDSLGNYFGTPYMKEADSEFDAHSIHYNFKTKKGIVHNVITNEGESYIHGNKVYKTPTDILYIKNAKYTTCNLDTPHYHFNASKLKIIPNDKIVTGPANLVIEGAQTPIGIPFGFFPNNNKQHSGIIVPEPGENATNGFFLLNGGYYRAISDNLDAQLTGDIYFNGSWGSKLLSNYKKRYGFNGKIIGGYTVFKSGIKDTPSYGEKRNFFFNWTHNQDRKSRPNSNFGANVNISTLNNFTTDFNSSERDYLSNSFKSNITYTKSWAGKPYTLTLNAEHSQNSNSKNVTVALPGATFTVSRIFPFKKKVTAGQQKFYEKIGLSYTMNAKNQVTAGDSLFSFNNTDQLLQQTKNGVRHAIPLSTSLKLLKNFTLNPSINYTELWYLKTIRRSWDEDLNTVITDTVNGFERGQSYTPSANLSTTFYGMYQYKNGPIKALRHVVTPVISFSYIPNNRSGLRSYTDSSNTAIDYSIFSNNIYGTTHQTESSRINFDLRNNLEMKVRNRKDSINPLKKVPLLNALNFSTACNFTADSLQWSNIGITGRTNILKKLNVQFNGSIDPYALDSSGARTNTSDWKRNNSIGRLVSGGLTFGFNLKSGNNQNNNEVTSKYGTEEELEFIRNNPEEFIDFNVPWTLNFSYNIRYSKPMFNDSENIIQTIRFSGDVSLTRKWKIAYSSGYDFTNKDFSYTSIDIYRDMHCWEMKFNWVPFGDRQSYFFTIKVKASLLQDLKLTRKSLPNVF